MDDMKKPETKEEFLALAKKAGISKRNAQITASMLYDLKTISETRPVSSYDLAPRYKITSARINAIVANTKKKLGL